MLDLDKNPSREGQISIKMELVPTSSAHGISHIASLWSPEFGIIFSLLQDGWIVYLDMVCVDHIVKIELKYLLPEFLWK